MISERWLIDVNAIPESATTISTDGRLYVAWSAIVNAPIVDAVEVVHGRWMGGYKNRKGRWLYTKPCCSVCSFEQEGISNYCPNCGAKMDLEDE